MILGGLTIADGSSHSETIAGSVLVPAKAYMILANGKSATPVVPAGSIAYKYSTLTLANGSTGAVTLKSGATVDQRNRRMAASPR